MLFLLIILYPVIFIIFILWISIKKQSVEDTFFIDMFPRNRKAVYRRLEVLAKLGYPNVRGHKEYLDTFLNKYPRLNTTLTNRIEYYFQAVYFRNFKDKLVAFKTASLPLKMLLFSIAIISNLTITAFAYELLELGSEYSFLNFYLIFSLIIFLVTLLFVLIQVFILGLFLSFVSLFDSKGKIRRMSVHLEEIVRSLKPGGRKAIVGLADMDEFLGFRPH